MNLEDLQLRLSQAIAAHPETRYAFLFGSAVTRGVEAARDLDVAASFIRTPSLFELGRLEGELEQVAGRPVDLVDLDQATTLLRWEVARTGRPLRCRDTVGKLEFLARAPLEYFDLEPHLVRQARGLRRTLGIEP